jgi:hypothetical protein
LRLVSDRVPERELEVLCRELDILRVLREGMISGGL